MTNDELIRNPTIENLTRFAELNAAAKFQKFRKIPTTLWCIGNHCVKAVGAMNLPTDKANSDFYNLARQLCIAESAKAAIYMAEVWVGPPNSADIIRPSQHPARRECVQICSEFPGQSVTSLYSILRDQTGKPRLGKCELSHHVEKVNVFLPITTPSSFERAQAAFLIERLTKEATHFDTAPMPVA